MGGTDVMLLVGSLLIEAQEHQSGTRGDGVVAASCLTGRCGAVECPSVGGARLPGEVVDGVHGAVGGVHRHEAGRVRVRAAGVDAEFRVDVDVPLFAAGGPDQVGHLGGVVGVPVVA